MIKLDTFSGEDSAKIIDTLVKDNIKYTKLGSKIGIYLDRNTAKASVLLSQLHKLAKFEELMEGDIIKKEELMEGDIIKKIDKMLIEGIKDDKEAEQMIKILREDLKKLPNLSKDSKKEYLKNIKSTLDDLIKYYK